MSVADMGTIVDRDYVFKHFFATYLLDETNPDDLSNELDTLLFLEEDRNAILNNISNILEYTE